MASSPSASQGPPRVPNTAFRRLRGTRSPAEFAAAVRRAARAIGEQVACDARYIGRVEAGEIRCPNYAYERVFLHMFPGRTLTDMGFAPREAVRGRGARPGEAYGGDNSAPQLTPRQGQSRTLFGHRSPSGHTGPSDTGFTSDAPDECHNSPACQICSECPEIHEESDVLRRAFMINGPAAALAAMPATTGGRPSAARPHRRIGESEAESLEHAVRRIRLLDDRHGAGNLYRQAGDSLRAAYELLDAGVPQRQSVTDRVHHGAGELAISVGWLAHDSDRYGDARSHYAEALATARVASDPALEAHAFCNTAFLARDAGRPREAVRAAQAGQQAAKHLGSARLLSLLTMREAGGWAGLGDTSACNEALGRAHTLFDRGTSDTDPAWMSFFGEAELAGLEAQCRSALHDWERAAEDARRAVDLQDPHFVRNKALFTAELAGDLAAMRRPEEAADAGSKALALLGPVQSSRISSMLDKTAERLRPYAGEKTVGDFLARQEKNRQENRVPRPRTA
ncbi:hypothetical protein [Streptomyces sp. WMMB 714]|uniref:hypothetical protein n=1 Tax=Streptomyces sp. WMMB 714 TaxID=1286822 RepID=UPI0005F7CE21|nr:hypothetical protein [Streptomyces sp. WMMB 714]